MFAFYPTQPDYIIFTAPATPRSTCRYASRAGYSHIHNPYHYSYNPILELNSLGHRRHAYDDEATQRQQRFRAWQEQERRRHLLLAIERERLARQRQEACHNCLREQQLKREILEQFMANHSNTCTCNTQRQSQTSTASTSHVNPPNRTEAAQRIYRFVRHRTANKQVLRTLQKLGQLRSMERRLAGLRLNSDKVLTLKFSAERERQVLPTSDDNKDFLGKEEAILGILDQLDRITAEGAQVIRERRKQIVRTAQRLLDDLDVLKDKQWNVFVTRSTNGGEQSVPKDSEKTVAVKKIEIEDGSVENEQTGKVKEDTVTVETTEETKEVAVAVKTTEENSAVVDKNGTEATPELSTSNITEETSITMGTSETIVETSNTNQVSTEESSETEIKPYTLSIPEVAEEEEAQVNPSDSTNSQVNENITSTESVNGEEEVSKSNGDTTTVVKNDSDAASHNTETDGVTETLQTVEPSKSEHSEKTEDEFIVVNGEEYTL